MSFVARTTHENDGESADQNVADLFLVQRLAERDEVIELRCA